MMKKWFRISMVLLSFLFFLAACGAQKVTSESWVKIERQRKIIVGLDDSFVPMGFRQKNGQLAGYDIDLAEALFKRYNIKVDFQTIEWSMKETELKNQTIDLIWNGYTITPQRKKQVAFSMPYLANKQVVVTMKDDNINSLSQLRDQSLGVQSGSSGLNSLTSQPKLLKNTIANQTPVLYETYTSAFIDLKVGRIKGLLIDSVYANYYIAQQAKPRSYQVIQTPFTEEYFAVGMRKSDTILKQKIDNGLKAMKKDGSLRKIQNKWFSKN